MALNKFIGIGNLGKDAEVRQVGDAKVANFSIAITEKYNDKNGQPVEKTEWINIVAWRGLAEVAEKFFKKGTKLYVEGKFTTRSWDKDDGSKAYSTEILLEKFEFCGSPQTQSQGQNQNQGQASTKIYDSKPPAPKPLPDDDLPF